MICITEIKVVDVDRDFVDISRFNGKPPFAQVVDSEEYEMAEVKIEHIRGRTFVNNNRETVCIGLSEQVQEAIGLPFEAFDNMKNELDSYLTTISQLRSRSAMYQDSLARFNGATWWGRIKYLFKNI